MTICVEDTHFVEQVERALYEEFSPHRTALGRPGFFHPDELSFGDDVYLSRLVARVSAVPGVRWVDPHRFKRRGHVQATEIDDGFISIGRLEIARCDNDPNLPDNGQIRFFMQGGA